MNFTKKLTLIGIVLLSLSDRCNNEPTPTHTSSKQDKKTIQIISSPTIGSPRKNIPLIKESIDDDSSTSYKDPDISISSYVYSTAEKGLEEKWEVLGRRIGKEKIDKIRRKAEDLQTSNKKAQEEYLNSLKEDFHFDKENIEIVRKLYIAKLELAATTEILLEELPKKLENSHRVYSQNLLEEIQKEKENQEGKKEQASLMIPSRDKKGGLINPSFLFREDYRLFLHHSLLSLEKVHNQQASLDDCKAILVELEKELEKFNQDTLAYLTKHKPDNLNTRFGIKIHTYLKGLYENMKKLNDLKEIQTSLTWTWSYFSAQPLSLQKIYV